VRIARPYDAWLKDGFATFSTLLYLKSTDPDAYKAELAKQAVQALKYQDTSPVISGLNLGIGTPKYDSIVASKGAWILYMLGQVIGEDTLQTALVEFYDQFAGSAASITDFSKHIKNKTGEDYGWFFLQWVETVGVPQFQLEYAVYKLKDGGFKTRGQIRQDMELFRMPMEVLIETKGKPEEKSLTVNGQNTSFEFATETLPVRLKIDPNGKILMDSEQMRVAVHIALGDEYREKGEYITAIEEYEKATALNARSSLAHFRLGETFFIQHSYSNAANSLRDSLNGDLKPEWVETWVHIYMGKVYDILGQRERAKAEYQKAINSKIDYNGAQSEAERYLDEPFTKPDTVIG
jgi:aminopeptidase N